MTREEVLASIAGNTNGSATKSKTDAYTVTMANKKGELKSVGMLNLWNRFNEKQQKQIISKLSEIDGIIIEKYTGESQSTDDEF